MDVDCWIDTDLYGRVLDASEAGARLLNLTARGLMGRQLWMFFIDRDVIEHHLRALRAGEKYCAAVAVNYRPMERKSRRVVVQMLMTQDDTVRWRFSSSAALIPQGGDHPRGEGPYQPSF